MTYGRITDSTIPTVMESRRFATLEAQRKSLRAERDAAIFRADANERKAAAFDLLVEWSARIVKSAISPFLFTVRDYQGNRLSAECDSALAAIEDAAARCGISRRSATREVKC